MSRRPVAAAGREPRRGDRAGSADGEAARQRLEIRRHFDAHYGRGQAVAAEVERAALGHAVGLNGYTTVEQAEELIEILGLGPGDRLLDLGTGRGWPGLHLALRSGCRLVACDRPLAALRQARARFLAEGPGERAAVVVADGGRLPFAPGSFDAVVHGDVF